MPVQGINSVVSFTQTPGAQLKYQQPAVAKTSTINTTKPAENKKSKTPVVVASVALAALCVAGGIYGKNKGWFAKGAEKIKTQTKTKTKTNVVETIKEQINKINQEIKDDVAKLLNENKGKDLGEFDRMAGDISGDAARGENRFHFGATLIEDSYIDGYSRAELKDGKNMFNWIANRLENESDSLSLMYAQMEKPEAKERVAQFAQKIAEADSHTGMTFKEFVQLFDDKLFQKGADKLAELKK